MILAKMSWYAGLVWRRKFLHILANVSGFHRVYGMLNDRLYLRTILAESIGKSMQSRQKYLQCFEFIWFIILQVYLAMLKGIPNFYSKNDCEIEPVILHTINPMNSTKWVTSFSWIFHFSGLDRYLGNRGWLDQHDSVLDRCWLQCLSGRTLSPVPDTSESGYNEGSVKEPKGVFKYYISMFSIILDPDPPPLHQRCQHILRPPPP